MNRNTKRNKNRKFNKDKTKQNFKKGFETEDRDLQMSTNDPEWYANSPELLRDAASIPFSWPQGNRIDYDNSKFKSDSIPGLLNLEVRPCVGTSLNSYSPINVASSAIYSFVRHANSGHANYDAPDLMLYLLGMSSVYSFVTWAQRLLGMVMMYDQRNRYMPYALVTSQQVNFEDLKQNIANFRFWLNNFITKVASFAVPDVMPVFKRMAFLYSNLYIEGESVKDQMYMISPNDNYFLKFEIASDHGRLSLKKPTKAGTYYTTKEIMDFGEGLFNAMWSQEDFGIMSGDILKAYGSDHIVRLAAVPVDYTIAPIYDPIVLNQIKNADMVGNATAIGPIDADPNGYVSSSVMLNTSLAADVQAKAYQDALANKLLVVDYADPSPEVIIEATRFKLAYDSYNGVFDAGTELPFVFKIWFFTSNMQLTYMTVGNGAIFKAATTVTDCKNTIISLWRIQNFKYHPAYQICEVDNNNAVVDDTYFEIWDVNNYGVLSNADLSKMHQTAMMSLFAVPAIAKI